MAKFNVGDKVYVFSDRYAGVAIVKAVLPKKRFFSQKYLIVEGWRSGPVKVVPESSLVERKADQLPHI